MLLTELIRVSNRPVGLISRSFRETFWWKFSRIRGYWNGEF